MRRKDREVLCSEKIKDIIMSCHCCRLGLNDNGKVYIVPLNFGFEEKDGEKIFYFHSASEGRKMHLMRENPCVGFELDTDFDIKKSTQACEFSSRFSSVIGYGKITFIEDEESKIHALKTIMSHYTNSDDWEFSTAALPKVCVYKLTVEELACKHHE